MSKYSQEAKDAYDGIEEAGTSCTITRVTGGGGPLGGGTSTIQADTHLVETSFESQEVDGTSVLRDDLKLIIPAHSLTLQPTAGDTVTYAGRTVQVINTMPVAPDGTPIIYEVQARR
ncbi:hypothetical protein [Pseudovibrio sp. SPO723]|uniref:hypothetical protein n=1 Tax=Nesiotobacter zosterae TaxID=392721 RepID=UPI0029C42D32|nr:hypothetical protein [Pseudovibrio sp. SPO723]MDX5592575.1 hypothetical protein [Pseudovibrio sp. SPO723]